MTIETNSSVVLPAAHASQYYADFDPSTSWNKNEQSLSTYTSIPVANRTLVEPSIVVNQLVNQRFSPRTQQQLNSQQILRITQYIDNQENAMNNKLTMAICTSIVGIVVGLVCIGLAVVYRKDLCGYDQTSTSCVRIYSAFTIGSISTILGVLRMAVYCTMKMRITRAKRIWNEQVTQLQEASVHGY